MNGEDEPRIEAGLREVLGGESPPDLRARVYARLGATPVRTSQPRRAWLTAALVLLGVVVVVLLAVDRSRGERLAAGPPDPPAVDAVRTREALLGLPATTRRLLVLGGIAGPELKLLGRFPELRDLELRVPCTDDDFVHLRSLTKLQRLVVTAVPITGVGLAALAPLPLLEELVCSSTDLNAEGLRAVARLPNLSRLHVHSCRYVDADGIDAVVGMQGLRELTIDSCGGVPKTSFLRLLLLLQLEALDLANNDGGAKSSRAFGPGRSDGIGVDDAVLAALAGLPHLQKLGLGRCHNLTPAGMVALGRFPELRALDLTALAQCMPAAIEVLPESLRELGLEFGELDDAALRHLVQRLPQLERLDLSYSDTFSAVGLREVLALPKLRDLAVRDRKVSLGLAGEPLVVASHLQRLDLERCQGLGPDDCAVLALLPALRELRLSGIAGLGDADLAELARSRSLRCLALGAPNAVTIEGLRALQSLQLAALDLRPGTGNFVPSMPVQVRQQFDSEMVVGLARSLWPGCQITRFDATTWQVPAAGK